LHENCKEKKLKKSKEIYPTSVSK